MSVIAKLSIQSIKKFGTGQAVQLACVCANDLMAAYAESEEDRLFTKYSPWGEMTLHQPDGSALGKEGDVFYAMLLTDAEASPAMERWHLKPDTYWGPWPGSYGSCGALCRSLTDFGDGMAKTVEFTDHDQRKRRGIDRLNWKMSVDNPGATSQFRPGASDYYLVLYPESAFDRDKAIRAAHAHDEAA